MHIFWLVIGSSLPTPQKTLNTGSDLRGPNVRLDAFLLLKQPSGPVGSSPLCSLLVNHHLIPAGSGNVLPQSTNLTYSQVWVISISKRASCSSCFWAGEFERVPQRTISRWVGEHLPSPAGEKKKDYFLRFNKKTTSLPTLVSRFILNQSWEACFDLKTPVSGEWRASYRNER